MSANSFGEAVMSKRPVKSSILHVAMLLGSIVASGPALLTPASATKKWADCDADRYGCDVNVENEPPVTEATPTEASGGEKPNSEGAWATAIDDDAPDEPRHRDFRAGRKRTMKR